MREIRSGPPIGVGLRTRAVLPASGRAMLCAERTRERERDGGEILSAQRIMPARPELTSCFVRNVNSLVEIALLSARRAVVLTSAFVAAADDRQSSDVWALLLWRCEGRRSTSPRPKRAHFPALPRLMQRFAVLCARETPK